MSPSQRADRKHAIRAATKHLGIKNMTCDDLARAAARLDDKTFSDMLALLSQPDPHGYLIHDIKRRYSNRKEDVEHFSEWIRGARLCYHDVNNMVHSVEDRHDETTTWIIDGLHHYREQNPGYTDEQIRDFAVIVAAAYVTMIDFFATSLPSVINSQDDVCGTQFHPERICRFLKNGPVMELAASSHEQALEIIRVIREYKAYGDDRILYFLEHGGSPALAEGAL